MQERNERLYYRVMVEHFEEFLPALSAGTVNEACRWAPAARALPMREGDGGEREGDEGGGAGKTRAASRGSSSTPSNEL